MYTNETLNIESELKKIWANDLYKDFCTYKPIASSNILKNSLLFIGINPSRSNNEQIPTTNEKRCEVGFYSLDQTANYKYFKKFEDISIKTNHTWTHLDLLFFQETDQNKIYDILKQANGLGFIFEQLQIADKLIKESNPKIIIVNNALAATFLGRDKRNGKDVWLGYDFVFDEEIGTSRWCNIPVFFTSMLTGQRALDNGSYERLVWHIKQVLK